MLLVVWSVALLSILAAGLGSHGAFALGLTDRMDRQLRSRAAVRSAVSWAVDILAADASEDFDGLSEDWANGEAFFNRQPVGSSWFTVRYEDEGVTHYGLVDEQRKFNLNAVPAPILTGLLRRLGVREEEARTIAESVEDWRDEDKDQRPYGAEDFYYGGLDGGYECKDASFEQLEEFRLVRGVTPAIFQAAAPHLTVYGAGPVNINTARRAVLEALGISEIAVVGILYYRVGEDNLEGTPDDRVIGSSEQIPSELSQYVPLEDGHRLALLVQDGVIGVRSDAFRLHAVGASEDAKHAVQLEAVFDRDGRIYVWRES